MGSEVRRVADLFQEHRDELGFVNEAQVREKCVYTVYRGERLAGAVLCNHCVRKPQTTLYDIAVREEYRDDGVGSTLVERMVAETPHEKIVAKCPATLPAVQFYNHMGWQLVAVEDGNKRSLTVWEYRV